MTTTPIAPDRLAAEASASFRVLRQHIAMLSSSGDKRSTS